MNVQGVSFQRDRPRMRMPPPSHGSATKGPAAGGAASADSKGDRSSASVGLRPRRLAELRGDAEIHFSPTMHTMRRWCTTADNLLKQGSDAVKSGDLDNGFIYLLRSSTIVIELIPKCVDFNASDALYILTKKKMADTMSTLEELSAKLKKRDDDWDRAASEAAAVKPAVNGLPKAPPVSSKVAEGAGTRPSEFGRSPPVDAFTATQSTVISSPFMNVGMDVKLKPQPAEKPQALSSAKVNTSLPAELRESASALVIGTSPTVASNVSTSHSNFNGSSVSSASSKETADQLSLKATASVSNSTDRVHSNHHHHHHNHNTKSSKKAAPVDELKMTAAELHMGLVSTLPENLLRVLLIDVRSIDEYMIQGHMKWSRRSTGTIPSSGLVQIEPDWITDGVTAEYLSTVLKGFCPEAEDMRPFFFETRNEFDLVILHDYQSESIRDSKPLRNLYRALTDPAAIKPLKMAPILLNGGFFGWLQFVISSQLRERDWVEYGHGYGGEQDQGPKSARHSPNPSTAAKNIGISQPLTETPSLGTIAVSKNPFHQPAPKSSIESNRQMFDNPFNVFSHQPDENEKAKMPPAFTLKSHMNNPFMSSSNSHSNSSLAVPAYPTLPSSNGVLFQRSSSNPGSLTRELSYPALPTPSSLSNSTSSASPAIPPKIVNPVPSGTPALSSSLNSSTAPKVPASQSTSVNPSPLRSTSPERRVVEGSLIAAMEKTKLNKSAVPPPIAAKIEAANRLPPELPPKRLGIAISPESPSDFSSRSGLGSVSSGLVGLRNLGNTCFMNSVLQCLNSTTPLARFFLGGSYRRYINRLNSLGSKGVIADEYASLVKSVWNGQEDVVNPKQFKGVIGQFNSQFRGTEQHDSQEFLGYLLDAIHEDFNVARKNGQAVKVPEYDYDDESVTDSLHQSRAWATYKMLNWSIIVDLFQGQLKSQLRCLTCNKTSTTYNPFMYLSVPIPERNSLGKKGGAVFLTDCLAKFNEIEILDGDDAWNCPRCKMPRKASKALSIARLPPILIIHLKRFYYSGPFKNKIETYVDFPIHALNMSPFCLDPTSKNMYNLYAVSNHMGTLSQGHYTAQAHIAQKRQWYLFDDSRVSSCTDNDLKSEYAYMLFYVRNNTTGVKMTATDWWKDNPQL